MWSPVLPMLAIQLGWVTAEVGRQPWIVWQELRTVDAISKAVPAAEVMTTLALFTVFYTIVYVAWARVVIKFIKQGPVVGDGGHGAAGAPVPTGGSGGAEPAVAAASASFSSEGVE